jgi:hypothetical protein
VVAVVVYIKVERQERVEQVAVALLVREQEIITALQELLTQAVAVVEVRLILLLPLVEMAVAASSSSRSTNKDLWKPKSTDFSA